MDAVARKKAPCSDEVDCTCAASFAVADQVVAALGDALPHVSALVRLTDSVTGDSHLATHTSQWHEADHEAHEALGQMFAMQNSIQTASELSDFASLKYAMVPIRSDCATNGLVAALSHRPDFPTPQDQAVLQLAADAARTALNHIGSERLAGLDTSMKQTTGHSKSMVKRQSGIVLDGLAERRSEYMDAMGTLAAGISHDMGNLLLPIRLRLSTIEAKIETAEFAKDFEAIRDCLNSMQRLTRGLELFATSPESVQAADSDVQLFEWWSEVEPFVRNVLPSGVQLRVDIPQSMPRIRIARHLLAQALLCIVQNAAEALRSRGDGCVSIRAHHDESSDSVTLSISDDGPGMTEEVRNRCFEPFFTTKTRAISTGLGLALVHGIIHRAGGSIALETSAGQGTTVSLQLPSSPGKAALEEMCLERSAVISIADARLQAFVTTMLKSFGFATHDQKSATVPRATLWITDDAEAALGQAEAFLIGPENSIIVLDDIGVDYDDTRIFEVGRHPDRGTLSRTISLCAIRIVRATEERTSEPIFANHHRD